MSEASIPSAKDLSASLGAQLARLGAKAASCESCTAGAVADAISAASGASAWFEVGLVCYSEAAKTALAGVEPRLFAESGVVSSEVALAMAFGAANAGSCRFGVATTGLAGPGGATGPRGPLPAGLVCFAVADASTGASKMRSEVFSGGRDEVRSRAARRAMELLLEMASGSKPAPARPAPRAPSGGGAA